MAPPSGSSQTLRHLIAEHNRDPSAVPLSLETVQPEPDASGTAHESRRRIYAALRDDGNSEATGSLQDRIAVVFDNSWDSELGEATQEINEAAPPIVFLNGDRPHPPGTLRTSRGRMFLGSGYAVPTQIATLVREVLASGRGAERAVADRPFGSTRSPAFAFVAEPEDAWPTTGRIADELVRVGYSAVLPERPRDSREDTFVHIVAPVTADGSYHVPDRAALQTVRADLLRTFHDYDNPDIRKVVVINTHAEWGSLLVRWIDTNFRNATIVGYPNIISRDYPADLDPHASNELVMLSQGGSSLPTALSRCMPISRSVIRMSPAPAQTTSP